MTLAQWFSLLMGLALAPVLAPLLPTWAWLLVTVCSAIIWAIFRERE